MLASLSVLSLFDPQGDPLSVSSRDKDRQDTKGGRTLERMQRGALKQRGTWPKCVEWNSGWHSTWWGWSMFTVMADTGEGEEREHKEKLNPIFQWRQRVRKGKEVKDKVSHVGPEGRERDRVKVGRRGVRETVHWGLSRQLEEDSSLLSALLYYTGG